MTETSETESVASGTTEHEVVSTTEPSGLAEVCALLQKFQDANSHASVDAGGQRVVDVSTLALTAAKLENIIEKMSQEALALAKAQAQAQAQSGDSTKPVLIDGIPGHEARGRYVERGDEFSIVSLMRIMDHISNLEVLEVNQKFTDRCKILAFLSNVEGPLLRSALRNLWIERPQSTYEEFLDNIRANHMKADSREKVFQRQNTYGKSVHKVHDIALSLVQELHFIVPEFKQFPLPYQQERYLQYYRKSWLSNQVADLINENTSIEELHKITGDVIREHCPEPQRQAGRPLAVRFRGRRFHKRKGNKKKHIIEILE